MNSDDWWNRIAALTQLVRDFAMQFRKREKVLFHFTEAHSLSRLSVALVLTAAVVGPVFYQYFGWAVHVGLVAAIAIVFGISAVITVGLRTTIVVTEARATITKKWFLIPYRQWSARKIEDVSYGGDWGKSDYAAGVVVLLGDKEIHVGSGKTMHELYPVLLSLSSGPIKPSTVKY